MVAARFFFFDASAGGTTAKSRRWATPDSNWQFSILLSSVLVVNCVLFLFVLYFLFHHHSRDILPCDLDQDLARIIDGQSQIVVHRDSAPLPCFPLVLVVGVSRVGEGPVRR